MQHNPLFTRRLAPIVAVVALVGVGCSDSSSGSDRSAATSTTAKSDTTAATTTTTAAASGDGATSTTVDGASDTTAKGGDTSSGSFTLLTYNVAGLPEGMSGSHPATNTPLIGPKLNAYDVVAMQETWKSPDPNPLAPTRVYHEILEAASTHPYKTESAKLPLGKDTSRPEALVADGLNVFSKFELGPVTRERWTECLGVGTENAGDCMAQKGFAAMTMTVADGAELVLVDLHGEAGSSAEDNRMRANDYQQLTKYLTANAEGKAVIVTGDFNLHTDPADTKHPEDDAIYTEFLAGLGLTDSCVETKCDQPERIDKVAYRSSDTLKLTADSWKNVSADFLDSKGQPLSDHDPVVVNMTWELTK